MSNFKPPFGIGPCPHCLPVPPHHMRFPSCASHPDLLHPFHYPGMACPPPRPEPYYGTLKIVEAAPTTDHEMTAVRYADGRYDMIANGYVMEPGTVTNNGPRCLPWDEDRGNSSNSEGMDCINYEFNNSDCGATF